MEGAGRRVRPLFVSRCDGPRARLGGSCYWSAALNDGDNSRNPWPDGERAKKGSLSSRGQPFAAFPPSDTPPLGPHTRPVLFLRQPRRIPCINQHGSQSEFTLER